MAPRNRDGSNDGGLFPWPGGSHGDESHDYDQARGDGLHGEVIPPEEDDAEPESYPPEPPEDEREG